VSLDTDIIEKYSPLAIACGSMLAMADNYIMSIANVLEEGIAHLLDPYIHTYNLGLVTTFTTFQSLIFVL
jgi:hypothetical protein